MKQSTKVEIVTTLAAILLFAAIILTGYLIDSRFKREAKKAQKWAEFYECSKDYGDWGCDSCYHAVFGKWSDKSFYPTAR